MVREISVKVRRRQQPGVQAGDNYALILSPLQVKLQLSQQAFFTGQLGLEAHDILFADTAKLRFLKHVGSSSMRTLVEGPTCHLRGTARGAQPWAQTLDARMSLEGNISVGGVHRVFHRSVCRVRDVNRSI